jgi:hypothetical protein
VINIENLTVRGKSVYRMINLTEKKDYWYGKEECQTRAKNNTNLTN